MTLLSLSILGLANNPNFYTTALADIEGGGDVPGATSTARTYQGWTNRTSQASQMLRPRRHTGLEDKV